MGVTFREARTSSSLASEAARAAAGVTYTTSAPAWATRLPWEGVSDGRFRLSPEGVAQAMGVPARLVDVHHTSTTEARSRLDSYEKGQAMRVEIRTVDVLGGCVGQVLDRHGVVIWQSAPQVDDEARDGQSRYEKADKLANAQVDKVVAELFADAGPTPTSIGFAGGAE